MAFLALTGRRGIIKGFTLVDKEDRDRFGVFTWYMDSRSDLPKYVYRRFNGKRVFLHRLIIGNVPEGMEVDHINRNPLDNRRSNLRLVTRAQNQWNRRGGGGQQFLSKSKKWAASILVNKRRVYLGQFNTKEESMRAYREAVIKYRGVEWLPELTNVD